MGIFAVQTQLDVDLPLQDRIAGQHVEARVRVGAPDDRVVGGRLELLYRNTYQREGTDADGSAGAVTRTADVVVDRHCFADAADPVRTGEVTALLRLPSTAPPRPSTRWTVHNA